MTATIGGTKSPSDHFSHSDESPTVVGRTFHMQTLPNISKEIDSLKLNYTYKK
jgi:hypothetical protein